MMVVIVSHVHLWGLFPCYCCCSCAVKSLRLMV